MSLRPQDIPSLYRQTASGTPKNRGMEDDRTFRQLEQRLFAAHVSRDVRPLDEMYSDDFFSTNADGRTVNKREWLEMVGSGKYPVDSITTGGFRLRQHGDTAIITGVSEYVHQSAVVWSVRHTQVWVRDGPRWRLHLWHGTPSPR